MQHAVMINKLNKQLTPCGLLCRCCGCMYGEEWLWGTTLHAVRDVAGGIPPIRLQQSDTVYISWLQQMPSMQARIPRRSVQTWRQRHPAWQRVSLNSVVGDCHAPVQCHGAHVCVDDVSPGCAHQAYGCKAGTTSPKGAPLPVLAAEGVVGICEALGPRGALDSAVSAPRLRLRVPLRLAWTPEAAASGASG
jgi:hypothetical protein